MPHRYFQFPRREFDKYIRFESFDPELDVKSSVFISKDLKIMFRDAYNMTDKVYLTHDKENYAEVSGYYAFYKALWTHLVQKYWIPEIGNLNLTKDIKNSAGMKYLKELNVGHPITDISSAKINIYMPRFSRGMYFEPIRVMEIFSMRFIVEYVLAKWFLDTDECWNAYREDVEYRLRQNDDIVKRTMSRIHEIVENGY